MIVTGIDPSLASTGVARLQHAFARNWRETTWHCPTAGKRADGLIERDARLTHIAGLVLPFVEGADLVVIESPSYGSVPGGSAHDRSGLWWRIVHRVLAQERPLVMVPPTTRAKWATGRGNADKAAVAAAVARMWPAADVSNSDKADALALATIGVQLLGGELPFPLHEYRVDALAKVVLPSAVA